MIFKSHSVEDTIDLGKQLGQRAKPGDIFCLSGYLAAGKTHFTKGIALGLGVAEIVDSPTFAIVNEYLGRLALYHFDVYRIKDLMEMEDAGYDYFFYGNGVCVIEWAELIEPLLPDYAVRINISPGAEANERIIEIIGIEPEGAK